MATPFMNLTLPVVTLTLGPDWASQLNAALEVVDTHDHSSGKGIKITPSGINITSDLNFNSNAAVSLQKTQFTAQSSTLTGSLNLNSLHSVSGDLYFTNGAGVAVQVTSGGSIISSPGAANSFSYLATNTNLSIGPADAVVYLAVDTTASRTITLPTAASIVAGRIYVIKDASGQSETNNITLATMGSDTIDGDSSLTIKSNWSTTFVIGNGVDGFLIV